MKLGPSIPVTPLDYRQQARRRLPRFLFDYIDGGCNEELTLRRNVDDFKRLSLKQRVMVDVTRVDTRTDLLGREASMPLALAPIGMAGMMRQRGEVQGARAALSAGVPFTLSTVGVCPVEEVQQATGAPFWFQLYMLRDRSAVESLMERAKAAGCNTLVFTVDLPIAGMRHRDIRNGMVGNRPGSRLSRLCQLATSPNWIVDVGLKGKPHTLGNLSELVAGATDLGTYRDFVESQFDPGVTWDDIAWLREQWKGKLLIKGVLEPEDAQAAAGLGADGLIVSNHGGRQLDSAASTIAKLPAIINAVGDQLEVYLDGGVRNGVDLVKAVALGARGVLIGRPWIWTVAAAGEEGLRDMLEIFRQEVATTMALMGVNRIDELVPELVEPGNL
ncbi:L-lactate dehydrogenase [Aestuariirhabdus sp. Z084]|uniref:L-lactate dehydrogenase n=1 Tax=Aestuariirhabdus haliotis TaxID=2918751 RepID=UPI00201B37F4|nr:L-lactate dehydrogenase [Aestuariirhabdus haliotis]MCL6417424.1 L-lactate dehydrogenase [Aestuariirhabdus haliotis]MCL6421368.1 L-lactate dehydrogenase [Aestuariirhabdus haliotis]